MTTVVLDLDGVVYRGDTAIAGAGATIRSLGAAGHRVVFCTNNSRPTRQQLAAKLSAIIGVEVDPADVMTSSLAAAHVADVAPTAVVGGSGIRDALEERGVPIVDDADATQVVSGLDVEFTFDRLRRVSDVLRAGAGWIATNTDASFPIEGGFMPGAGSIVAALAVASGRSPVVAGKPHPAMVAAIRSLVGDDRVVVVGDRPETDIALAKAGGWESVLVLSGVTADPASVPDELTADRVLDSIAALAADTL